MVARYVRALNLLARSPSQFVNLLIRRRVVVRRRQIRVGEIFAIAAFSGRL